MDVTIIVATCGDERWQRLAQDRALPSAIGQGHVSLHHEPRGTVASARNAAARRATSRWLCFLDADDELAPGYTKAMAAASGDLRAPAVQYVRDGVAEPAKIFDDRKIITGLSPCAIGTLIRRDVFLSIGGFWEERAWEDYSLFRRAAMLGSTIEHVPQAVYRAHEVRGSRNSHVVNPNALMRSIRASHDQWLAERAS